MPALGQRFTTFDSFARADLRAIFGARLDEARRWEARELRSGVLLNQAGRFEFRPFPRAAQTAPSFGVVATEIDGDGKPDLVLSQNFFTPQPETARMDGGVGMVLRGRGDGTFEPVRASGFVVPGDGKGLAAGDFNGDGRTDLAAAQNDGALLLFEGRGASTTPVRLKGRRGNPTAVGARVTAHLPDGSRRTVEVTAGGGYWSQSATALAAGRFSSIEVRWPDGATTTHPAAAGLTDLAQPLAPVQDRDERKGPGLWATLEERTIDGRPVFHIDVQTVLPDGAILDLRLSYDGVGPPPLRSTVVRVQGGGAQADLPVFVERTFPGRYRLEARASRADQPAEIQRWLRGRALTLEARGELQVGSAEDRAKARRGYLDALSAAFDRIDAVCKEVVAYPTPGDSGWSDAAEAWLGRVRGEGERYRPREENRVLNLFESEPDVYQRMEYLLGDLLLARVTGGEKEKERTALALARVERRRWIHLHKGGAPSTDLVRAGVLFDTLTRQMGQGAGAVEENARMIVELGALLPSQAQEIVQALAAEAVGSAPGSEKVRDLLARLQEWVDAVRIDR